MERMDKGLGFILQYENVAWYEDGKVRILDRRIYPIRTEYVECVTHKEVAQAITDMVTQSGGPYAAASMGMALAAYECRCKTQAGQLVFLQDAAETIASARPTTTAKMRYYVNRCLRAAEIALESGEVVSEAVFRKAVEDINERYANSAKAGSFLAGQFPNQGTVMTQCWGETVVGMVLRACRETSKEIKVICAETRPYYQGSRLTSSCVADMGFDVTVICDNMPAYVMNKLAVDVFTSAADVISMDGYVVNKIGTFQMALAAHYWGIPYYVSGAPNQAHPTYDTVNIELRDSELVLHSLDTRISQKGVKGYYPAFDITPPRYVSGVVTSKGIYSPYNLHAYYDAV